MEIIAETPNIIPEIRSPTDEVVKAMSNIWLRDVDIENLKEANQKLKEEMTKKDQSNEKKPDEVD